MIPPSAARSANPASRSASSARIARVYASSPVEQPADHRRRLWRPSRAASAMVSDRIDFEKFELRAVAVEECLVDGERLDQAQPFHIIAGQPMQPVDPAIQLDEIDG